MRALRLVQPASPPRPAGRVLARLPALPRHGWPVAALVLLGGALRLYRLDALSLWTDEGFTIAFTHLPWPAVLGLQGYYSAHPPLYYILVKAVALIAPDALAGRLVSALAGTATIPVVYALVARLVGDRAGLAAGLLLAASPLHIWASQDGRMYALVVLLVAASYLVLVAFLQHPSRRSAILYGLALALAMYADYSALFALAPQVLLLCLALRMHRRRAVAIWTAACGAVLAFLPWLPQVLATVGAVGDDRQGLDAGPSQITLSLLAVSGLGGNGYFFYGSQPSPWDRWATWQGLLLLGIAPAVVVGAVVLARRSRPALLIAAGLLAGTIAIASAISLITPSYAARTTLALVLGWVILAGASAADARLPRGLGALGPLSLAFILAMSAVSMAAIYRGAEKQEWRQVADDVAAVSGLGKPILIYSAATKAIMDAYRPYVPTTRLIFLANRQLEGNFARNELREANIGDARVVNGAIGPILADGGRRDDAIWLVYSDGGPDVEAVQRQLASLGYERIMHKLYWNPLYLDYYALPDAALGRDVPINGRFAGDAGGAAGWTISADGMSFSTEPDAGRRLVASSTVAGEQWAYTQVAAEPGGLYTLQFDAQSRLTSGSLNAFLICMSAAGTWSSVAPNGAGASIPNDGAWHTVRVASLCPAGTATIRIDLRNSGVGQVSFRGVHLFAASGGTRAGEAPQSEQRATARVSAADTGLLWYNTRVQGRHEADGHS